MNRAQEIATIESHIAIHGLYQCAPGESFYGDEAIPVRACVANYFRNHGRPRNPPRHCRQCGKQITGKHSDRNVFCGPACSAIGRRSAGQKFNCANCGEEVYRPPSRARRERVYCNNACRWGKARAHGRRVAA